VPEITEIGVFLHEEAHGYNLEEALQDEDSVDYVFGDVDALVVGSGVASVVVVIDDEQKRRDKDEEDDKNFEPAMKVSNPYLQWTSHTILLRNRFLVAKRNNETGACFISFPWTSNTPSIPSEDSQLNVKNSELKVQSNLTSFHECKACLGQMNSSFLHLGQNKNALLVFRSKYLSSFAQPDCCVKFLQRRRQSF